jgi:hypothetical protein
MDLHIPFVLVIIALFLAPFAIAIAADVLTDDDWMAPFIVYAAIVLSAIICWTLAGFLIGRR